MVSNQFYIARRQALLASCLPNSVCVLPAASLQKRSNDTEYIFRQNSDFYYLTGFNEPDAWLVLSNDENRTSSAIICLPTDEMAEIWHGRRLGPQSACEVLAVDESFSTDDLSNVLTTLIEGHDHLYSATGEIASNDDTLLTILNVLRGAPKQSKKAPSAHIDIRVILHDMRLFKTNEELTLLRHAASISADAHINAMRACKPGMFEYQLEAGIHYDFAMQGARSPAYNTIVGSGRNACILHYTENCDRLNDGDLVLIDAGAEWQGYAGDITRTFPVSGKFTAPQTQIYELVLEAQSAAIEHLVPNQTISDAMRAAITVITEGLVRLNILTGNVQEHIEQQSYKAFFMHGLGHWLGLDVHDVGQYKIDGKDRPLKAGMVMTVEPGLYFSDHASVPSQYKGIGIRIEDDLIITEMGNEIISARVPKTIDEIEALMSGKQ